jgi:hypothetical protein
LLGNLLGVICAQTLQRFSSASSAGGDFMSAWVSSCALLLAQRQGNSPSIAGFGYGAGRVVGILLVVVAAGVLVALIRAGGCRK